MFSQKAIEPRGTRTVDIAHAGVYKTADMKVQVVGAIKRTMEGGTLHPLLRS